MSTLTFQPINRKITAITQANPGVVTTAVNHGYLDGLFVRIFYPPNQLFGMPEIANQAFPIVTTGYAANKFAIAVDTTNFSPFNGGIVTITNITQANPAVVTVTANPFEPEEDITIAGVTGMTQINGVIYIVVAVTATTITLDVDSTGFSPYISDGMVEALQNVQAIPGGEIALTLANAEKNNLTPIGGH